MSFEYKRHAIGGIQLHVGVRHDSSGDCAPPLLMLNGIGFNAQLMEPLADALPGRTIICPEMPGCGRSPNPVVPYHLMRMSKVMVGLMDQIVPGRNFDVLGFSWGGALAQQIAVQAPRRVETLTLISTTSGVPLPVGDPEVLRRLFDPEEYIDPAKLQKNFHAMLREGGAGAGLMRNFTAPTAQGVSCQILALAGWSAAALLPFVRMPVLLVGIADDPIVPMIHHRMLGCLIPRAHSFDIPSGGHLTPLASPRRVAPTISAFLNGDRKELAA